MDNDGDWGAGGNCVIPAGTEQPRPVITNMDRVAGRGVVRSVCVAGAQMWSAIYGHIHINRYYWHPMDNGARVIIQFLVRIAALR